MNKFKRLLKKIDEFAPDPWIVEGRVQARPLTQLLTMIGILIGLLIIIYFIV